MLDEADFDRSLPMCGCPDQWLQGATEDGEPNCVDQCDNGYFPRGDETNDEGRVCDVCQFPRLHPIRSLRLNPDLNCNDCVEDRDDCVECRNGYHLQDGYGCIETCNFGYQPVGDSDIGRTCVPCDDTENCASCPDNTALCTLCQNGYNLYNSTCLESCPENFVAAAAGSGISLGRGFSCERIAINRIPARPVINTVSASDLFVTWQAPVLPPSVNDPVLNYTLQWQRDGEDGVTIVFRGLRLSTLVGGLEPASVHAFRVLATYD